MTSMLRLKNHATRAIRSLPATICLFVTCLVSPLLPAADWPMWRYDAYRSAAAPHELPDDLQLAWVRHYSQREQVWDDPLNHDLMPYDRIFEPIILGDRIFFGFNDRDKVVALDLNSGRTLLECYTDRPVRFPPAAWATTCCLPVTMLTFIV